MCNVFMSFKVIKEKITMLEQFVQEFLHVYLGENDIPFMNRKNVVSQFSFVEKLSPHSGQSILQPLHSHLQGSTK